MKIAIIDAEIIGKSKHRFPNLCSMKLSSYHKSMGDDVTVVDEDNNIKIGTQPVYCLQEQCAWWVEDKQKCAVALTGTGGKK